MSIESRICRGLTQAVRWGTAAAACLPVVIAGQLQVLPEGKPLSVFGGGLRQVRVLVRNAAGEPAQAEARFQLLQLSATTAAATGAPVSWKQLRIQPGQTVVESVPVSFPEVRAATRFALRWLDASGGRLGTSTVMVYPTNLLSELRPLVDGKPIAVLDPLNQLKPALRELNVEFADLEQRDLEFYDGPLAILGPFSSTGQMPPNLDKSVRARAKAGTAVVWIQPPAGLLTGPEREPGSYLINAGQGAVFVAHSEALAGLNDHPQAQLNLIRFARLALRLEPLDLPSITP